MAKTFDSKCFELAEHFLEGGMIRAGHIARCNQLAAHIQQSIEDWLSDEVREPRTGAGSLD